MEFLVLVVALLALAWLAMRFGHDSRAQLVSREEQQAIWGLSWGPPPAARPRPRRRRSEPRRRLAAGLRLLARWLSPEVGAEAWPRWEQQPARINGRVRT
jgi:hypothetical protein